MKHPLPGPLLTLQLERYDEDPSSGPPVPAAGRHGSGRSQAMSSRSTSLSHYQDVDADDAGQPRPACAADKTRGGGGGEPAAGGSTAAGGRGQGRKKAQTSAACTVL